MLVGAASLVGAIRRSGDLETQVALVASGLASRVLYDRLYFRDQRLADFVPRTTIDPEGGLRVVGAPSHDGGGRLHVLSKLERLRFIEDSLAALVIDASAASPEAMRALMRRSPFRSIVYITTNPFDRSLEAIRDAGGVVWGWSASRVADLAAGTVLESKPSAGPLVADRALLAAAGRCDIEIDMAEGAAAARLDAAMERTWTSLSSLARAMPDARGERGRPPEALWWAWGVLNTLALLPVPPERYDRWVGLNPYVTRLGEASTVAAEFASNARGELADRWLQVAEGFGELLVAAAGSGRFSRALAWVAEIAESNAAGVLVTRNRAAAAATREALDESRDTPHGWSEHVRVVTLSELVSRQALPSEPSAVCLAGPLPRSRAGIIAMPPGTELRVVAAGEFEARRIAAQAVAARQAMVDIEHESSEVSSRRLEVPSSPPGVREAGAVRMVTAEGDTRTFDISWLESGGLENGQWEPFDPNIMIALRKFVDAGVLPQDDGTTVSTIRSGRGTDEAEAITIELDNVPDDRDLLVAGPNDTITRREADRIERVAAKAIRDGDVVLLVDHGARRDLLDTVLERLAETSEYSTLQYLIDSWHARAAHAAANSGLTRRQILDRMGGTRVTSENTVGNWIRGSVGGPRDREDVARFARAVGDDALLADAERTGWALATIHGLHQRIGAWLTRRLTSMKTDDQGLTIRDGETTIHVSDLMDAVSAHRVIEVDPTARRVPTVIIGTLVNRAEVADLQAN